jgi:hypothetical protein
MLDDKFGRLAKEAVDVQDACNPFGVARAMVMAMDGLRLLGVNGSFELRDHPVAILWAHKFADLFGVASCGIDDDRYAVALSMCIECGSKFEQKVDKNMELERFGGS